MNVPISTARDQFDQLVARAEAGEEIVLTRDGKSVVRLTLAQTESATIVDNVPARGSLEWRERIDEITRKAVAEATPSDKPAWDHSYLYDDDSGLPA